MTGWLPLSWYLYSGSLECLPVACTLDVLYTLRFHVALISWGKVPALYGACLGIHIYSVEAVPSLHFVKVSLLVLAGLRTGSCARQKD